MMGFSEEYIDAMDRRRLLSRFTITCASTVNKSARRATSVTVLASLLLEFCVASVRARVLFQ